MRLNMKLNGWGLTFLNPKYWEPSTTSLLAELRNLFKFPWAKVVHSSLKGLLKQQRLTLGFFHHYITSPGEEQERRRSWNERNLCFTAFSSLVNVIKLRDLSFLCKIYDLWHNGKRHLVMGQASACMHKTDSHAYNSATLLRISGTVICFR